MNFRLQINTFFSLLVVVFLFTQCGPVVQTNKTADVDLSKYDTYAYLPDPDTVQYEGIAEDVVAERSINAINDEMQEIGYEIDPDDPDLLIKTHVLLDQEENLYADPVYGSYNYYYPGFSTFYTSPYYYRGYSTIPRVVGYDIDEVDYTEGAMIVDIIDAETNEVVWRGYAGETVSPANFITDLNSYVDQIFDEYPVEDA